MMVCGTGYSPQKDFVPRRIKSYTEKGIDFRWDYVFEDMSPAFRATPMARYFADLFAERNPYADVTSIIYQFEALGRPDLEGHHSNIACPMIIISGSEDSAHARAFALKERIPGCEMKIIHGAGHACQLEQPWIFDQFALDFLKKHGLFPGIARQSAVKAPALSRV
jgi:pimeloyl-ACP methyl ester carboxylesterase